VISNFLNCYKNFTLQWVYSDYRDIHSQGQGPTQVEDHNTFSYTIPDLTRKY
jgi:hypothetical protein